MTTTAIRTFATGASRNADTNKHDFDGFLSPLFLEAFGAYMHFHRHLDDGSLRDSDNWQKGIPLPEFRKSLLRHVFDLWRALRGYPIKENILWAALGTVFNVQGIVHELCKSDPWLLARCEADMIRRRDARRCDTPNPSFPPVRAMRSAADIAEEHFDGYAWEKKA